MRVIAGSLKGRRLSTPDWPGLRPTSDRLRETVFNVLASRIAGARFLDGYAGTGAVGIEALSRGASHVTFVEKDRRAIHLIEQNLARCGVKDRYAIIRAGFTSAPSQLPDPFDLVFLDPPYDPVELRRALEAAAPSLAPEALLVIEHAQRHRSPDTIAGLRRTRELASGDSALSFYRLAVDTGQ